MRGCIFNKRIRVYISIIMINIMVSNALSIEAFADTDLDVNNILSSNSLSLSNEVYEKDVLEVSTEIDKIKEIQSSEEFREEAEYVESEIMFIRSEIRKVSFEPEYLRSDDKICVDNRLSNIEVVSESINSIFNEYVEYYVTYKARTNLDVWQVVDRLNENIDIICAEPNFVFQADNINEDEFIQYNMANSIVPTVDLYPGMASQWYLDDLDVVQNWGILQDNGLIPGNGTTVAVIDTGVRLTHEALKNSLWKNKNEIPGNGIDDDGNGYVDDVYGINTVSVNRTPNDDNGHGTHVAGIIAMKSKAGGVGIAYGTKILPIKAGNQNGDFEQDDVVEAINYAIKQNVDVINMSFAGGYSSIVEVAVKNAYNKQIILVGAAGNEGAPTSDGKGKISVNANIYDNYPAGSKYVLGVMAYDQYNELAEYSNWDYQTGKNAEYEIIAPGSFIYSTYYKSDSDYEFSTGTSMATPMVSAYAAILRGIYPSKVKHSNSYLISKLKSNKYVTFVDENNLSHNFKKINTNILPLVQYRNKIDMSACKITLSGTTYVYNGKNITPKVSIQFGNQTLVNGKHYSITYSNNKAIGKGKITIKGIASGEGYGTVIKYFNIVPPSVKSSKIAAYNTNAIKLQWSANSYANGYEIFRYNASTKKYVLVKRYNSKNYTSYTDKSLKSGTTYYYKIRCFRLVNNTRIYSVCTSAIKGTTVPGRVSLNYNTYSKSAIKLQWKKVTGASGYYIYRYSSKYKKYVKIKNVAGIVTSYTDTGLSSKTSYYYTVRAYKKFGNKVIYGGYAYKMKAYTGPSTPSITQSSRYAEGKIKIIWTPINGVSGYEILYSTAISGTYSYACGTSANFNGAIIGNIPSGTLYYRVRAYNIRDGKKVYSSLSNVVGITM